MRKVFFAIGLLFAGCSDRSDQPRPGPENPEEIRKAKDRAAQELEKAKAQLENLSRELQELDKQVDAAPAAMAAAQNEADRNAAAAQLDQLRRAKTDLERRIAETKAAAARAERMSGKISISKECLENPLSDACK